MSAEMAPDPMVFSLGNVDSEVLLDEFPVNALLATCRSGLPNQVNNALCFPGMFRGVGRAGVTGHLGKLPGGGSGDRRRRERFRALRRRDGALAVPSRWP